MSEEVWRQTMAKTVEVELTKNEIELLRGLVQDNIDSGTYWDGNR